MTSGKWSSERGVGPAVVFLDRDGTINVDHGYVHRIADWEFLPGAVEAIKKLRNVGFLIAVVSNQSGVGGGKYTREDVERLHDQVSGVMSSAGATVDAWAYCPHTSADDCSCRKPRTGMVVEIERQLSERIDFARSWMIGDKPADVEFGRRLGARSILLTSRYWTDADLQLPLEFQASSLAEAAARILGQTTESR